MCFSNEITTDNSYNQREQILVVFQTILVIKSIQNLVVQVEKPFATHFRVAYLAYCHFLVLTFTQDFISQKEKITERKTQCFPFSVNLNGDITRETELIQFCLAKARMSLFFCN